MDCIPPLHRAQLQTTHFVDSEISKTVSFMRRNGLLKFKKGDLEIELSPEALKRPKVKPEPLTILEQQAMDRAEKKAQEIQGYLDDPEACLFWSSGDVPAKEVADG